MFLRRAESEPELPESEPELLQHPLVCEVLSGAPQRQERPARELRFRVQVTSVELFFCILAPEKNDDSDGDFDDDDGVSACSISDFSRNGLGEG